MEFLVDKIVFSNFICFNLVEKEWLISSQCSVYAQDMTPFSFPSCLPPSPTPSFLPSCLSPFLLYYILSIPLYDLFLSKLLNAFVFLQYLLSWFLWLQFLAIIRNCMEIITSSNSKWSANKLIENIILKCPPDIWSTPQWV